MFASSSSSWLPSSSSSSTASFRRSKPENFRTLCLARLKLANLKVRWNFSESSLVLVQVIQWGSFWGFPFSGCLKWARVEDAYFKRGHPCNLDRTGLRSRYAIGAIIMPALKQLYLYFWRIAKLPLRRHGFDPCNYQFVSIR